MKRQKTIDSFYYITHFNNIKSILEKGILSHTNVDKQIGQRTSIAMPALGCGLGKLDWGDVGPLICKYLKELDIHVSIYLPTDRKISAELLAEEYLLSQN